MVLFGKRELAVVVLRDTDEITEAIRSALDTATAEERPGLERALELVTEAAAVGFDGPVDSVRAVKALRGAEPWLSLVQAVALTKEAAASDAGEPPAG